MGLPFINAIANSPLKVADARDADVTVLPVLLDWHARRLCKGSWDFHLHNMTVEAEAARRANPRIPQMIVSPGFKSDRLFPSIRRVLPKLRIGALYANALKPKPCTFRTGYFTDDACGMRVAPTTLSSGGIVRVGDTLPCGGISLVPRTPDDLDRTPRTLHVEFTGQVDGRRGYKDRWAFLHHRSKLPASTNWVTTSTEPKRSRVRMCDMRNTTDRAYCAVKMSKQEVYDIRSRTRYSLMLRGDKPCSDRLQNAMAALAVPVVLGPTPSWLPFPFAIPWHTMIANVSREDFKRDPAAALVALPEDTSAKRHSIAAHLREFSFAAEGSRVHVNLLRAALEATC